MVELQPIINRSLTTTYATKDHAAEISVAKPEAQMAAFPCGGAALTTPHHNAGTCASVGRTIIKLIYRNYTMSKTERKK